MSLGGKFEANVNLTPLKSQIFTMACLGICGLSLCVCFAFLWTGRAGWEVPLISSATAGAVGVLCWLLSHRNSELSGGKSTQFTVAEGRMSMTFDARNQPTKQMLLIFSDYAEAVAHREPLPPSSGFVDKSGAVISNSEVDANAEIDKLNRLAAQQAEQLGAIIGSGRERPLPSADISVPLYTGENPLEGVSGTGI
ncbi:hypothetical protein [Pseudomonas fluorescens]|uniref:hypothetical protein n=1 Tax=Pseudomonas fluorescens TaxID=294 RepID=UPI0011D26B6B|nr:hypothetical protein [Pseudomonas fluorescens]